MARAVAPGFPHYVVQRGNNRADVFFSPEDSAVYLYLLKTYADKWNAPIISYCLMTNHVHLLAKPSSDISLRKMMQGVALCYTQHVNRKYKRRGRLWESRYDSCIVDQASYLWPVASYIEQSPLRSKIVELPEEYAYSSARAHLGLRQDPVLGEDLFAEERRHEYIEFLKSAIPIEQIAAIRKSSRTGRPLGTDTFVSEIEYKLAKRLTALPVGRPRKTGEA